MKKFLSILLTLSMVLAMSPLTTVTVSAAETAPDIVVNAEWSSKAAGDKITEGGKEYTYGTDAFSKMIDVAKNVSTGSQTIKVIGSGDVGAKVGAESEEGAEFYTAGTYNVSGTEWANLGYLQLNPNKTTSETRYTLNISGSNLVARKIQLRGSSDLNITGSHVDFANNLLETTGNNSSGYLMSYKDSVITIKDSVVGYDLEQGNSSNVEAGKTSSVTQGNMHTDIYGQLNATNSTLFAFGGDSRSNAFALYDKGRATLTNSVLYANHIIIGATEKRDDRATIGYDGKATLTLDGSQAIQNNGEDNGVVVGDNYDGVLVLKNGSSMSYSSYNFTVNSNGTLSIDGTSSITASKFTNAGTITVDMTEATASKVTLISGGAGSSYGNYAFADGKANGYELKVDGNNLVAEKATPVAKIGSTEYATLAAAFADVNNQSGDDVTLTIIDDIEEAITGTYAFNKNVVITSSKAVNVNTQPISSTLHVYPNAGYTLTIDKDVTFENFGMLGDKNAGTTTVNGVINGSYQVYVTGSKVVVGPTGKIKTTTLRDGGNGELVVNGPETFVAKDFEPTSASDYQFYAGDYSTLLSGGFTDERTLTLDNASVYIDQFNAVAGNVTVAMDNSYLASLSDSEGRHFKTTGLTMTGGSKLVHNDSGVNVFGTTSIEAGSQIIAEESFTNNGTILVDMTGATEASVVLVSSGAGTNNFGTYAFADGKANGYELKVDGNNLVAEKATFFEDKDGIFHIVNLNGLQKFAASVQAGTTYEGKTVVLDASIDMASIANWTPIGTVDKSFRGTFDGKGCTISNLTIDAGTAQYASFFGYVRGEDTDATIKNLTFDNANVKGGSMIGIVAIHCVDIKNVTVKNSKIEGNEYVGAISGYDYVSIYNCTVENCEIKGTEQVGALGGYLVGGKIVDNAVKGCTVTATTDRVGGLVGKLQAKGSGEWSRNTIDKNTTVTAPDKVGGVAGQIMGDCATYEIKDNTIEATLTATAENGVVSPIAPLRSDTSATFAGALAANVTGNVWSSSAYAKNSYTYTFAGVANQVIYNGFYFDEGTYHIANLGGLKAFAASVRAGITYSGMTVVLDNDIDMASIENWTPIALSEAKCFKGTFDGKGHIISNLTIDGGDTANVSFFGYSRDPFIKNLTFDNANVKGGNDTNIVINFCSDVENVTVKNSTVVGNERVGTIGGAYTSVVNCTIEDCEITGLEQVGALTAYICGTKVTDNTVKGCKVVATKERAGGLVGKLQANGNSVWTNNTITSTTVTAPDQVGGIAGMIMGEVATYELKDNTIDVTLVSDGVKSPIGILRDGQNATFTGVLATNITGNAWTTSTYAANSYTYTNVAEGVDPQVIYNSPAAMIGDTAYVSLEAAIAAAVEAGVETEIDIASDIAYTEISGTQVVIPAAANIVLDLNGHTISGTSEVNEAYFFHNKGTVKIVDSGEDGKITFKSNCKTLGYNRGTSTILNRGTLTVADGTIENTTVGGASYAVDNQAQWYDEMVPIAFNMTGGELICTTGDAAIRQSSSLGETYKYKGEIVKNNINISGGTVTGDIWIQNMPASATDKSSYTDLQISDGTVTGKIYATVTDNTNLTATISGGNIGQLDRDNATAPFKEGIVKGGNFTNKPLDGFLAEGFKLVYDETTGKYVAEEQQVAKIGEKTYSTLNAAIKDVNNQTGDDVTLEILADITEELPHKTEIKFTKNLTITADSAVKVDFVDADNGVYLGPGNDKTLTIAENVTIRNLCTTGPDETTGTLIVNGTVGVSYIRAYGPKESDGIATTIINGKIIDDHEGCIRLSQNCKFVVNGNIAEGDDVRAAEKSLDGFYFSDVNCKNCEFILNNAAVGLYDWFEASSNINFTLNNSYVAYTTYYVVGNHTYTLDSSSAFDVKDTIKVFADSSLKVNGGDVALKTAINNGTATFEGTAKVNATSWAGNFNVKDATLTTDGFTQTSGKVNAFGTSTLTGFALKDVVVGFENSSETSDELTLAGETTCGDVYVGQDEVSERTYKLNVTGTATLGQAYVRQNGQVNIVDGADVKALYNCIYGQLNVTGGSTYTITGVNFYLAGRDSKNAKDKAIITVDNSTLNHPNSVGLEIGGGTGPAGSGKLVLKNGAVFNGTTLLLGDNAEGALGTIAVEATDSTINLTNALTIGAGDTVSLKKSTVSAKTVANAGTISVDMTGATDKVVTLITAANASDYGTYQILEGKDYNYELKVDGNNLVAEKNTDFFKDAEGVWHIATLKGLQQFAASVQAGNTYYGKKVVLDADIDMSSIENWTPICSGGKSFSGTFDGKGNTISNLTIDGGTAEGTSFFGDAGNPTIEGVTFDKATVKGGDRTSVVVNGLAYVTGVTVTNSSVVGNEYVAAIAGSAYTTIVGCTVRKCSIKAVEQVGALEGYVCGSKITGNTVDECTIEATAARAGGLAGKIQADDNGTTTGYVWSDNIITNTTVTAPDWVGGIAGQLMGEYATYEIKNNEIDATLDTTGTNVSPLAPLRAGQKAAFAGALSENVTDNTWTEKTWAENGYVFTNLPEGVEPQGSYNVKPNYNYYASLTLIENIDVNLVVGNLGEGFELDKLAVTVNGEAIDLELDGENVVGLLKSLAPYQISKTLSVVVTYGGEEIKSFDYSIRKYCVTVLTTEGFGVDSDLGKLCKAVLNYGKWAEDYYNEVQKTGEEPSIVNKDYEIDFTTVTIPKQPDTGFTPSTLFKAASASLALGSKISINFYVKTNVNLNKDNIKIVYTENSKDYQVDKNNIEITNDSGVYCIKVSNIDAAKLARTYKLVTAYAYADVFSVTYGAYTYCYDIQNLEGEGITDTLKTLCKAIYNYGEMAKAFN